ncbi:PTS sugar transporter subunit IIA [Aquincola tertiaricarbonis]|uniref:PTS sugar transporter subunit IIA n=1 Tax=Aquincola tertiaricarbonis TaxID=391953 RepID=A0ABY4SI69_AQUTE|nr:PTS sugar transporter subunit IIA [Aquincola tertiaricarbonis]URI11837.1 PTS sugar transporter subunit IIA [Aquincola tertiaricarbonis]
MPGLVILAHAPLASALRDVAQHTFPECAARIQAVDVTPEMTPEQAEVLAREALAKVRSPQALIFTDVFGATPCNVAQRLSDGVQVRVVTGVNVPMLWRALCYGNEPLENLVSRALAGATQGVMPVGNTRPQNQAYQTNTDAQDHAHHQQ